MTQAYVKGRRALVWLTKKLDAEAREAVWKAAEETSAGYSNHSLNEFIRPLPLAQKLKILVPWGVWVNLIENPMLMLGGAVAIVLLTLNLVASTISAILPGPAALTPAEQVQRMEELRQAEAILKGKRQ